MTHQERDAVMEAVTEAILEDQTLRQRLAGQEVLFAANMIRRQVARKLADTPPTTPRPAA